ncbi:MAG: amidohydrolase family protein [Halioglobus sp.]|nr:amidohydrolase family protein [Halioglobus sp.]
MQMQDMILVSVDDHVVEPPDMFRNHLAEQYKAQAPKVTRLPSGCDVWEFNGQKLPNIGLNAVVGRVPEEYGVEPTSYDQLRRGCYDVHARVADMNANGILGSICFPSFPGFVGQLWNSCEDRTLARVMLQAYNDWHIDEWAGSYPDRFIPLSMPAIWDPQEMAAEVRRVAKKGCRAVSFTENPDKLGLPSIHSDHWDPFWQACVDEGMVILIHIGSGGGMVFSTMDAPVEVMISTTPISIVNVAADLLFSTMLRKYPTLKFALSEGGIGWVPYFLERADYVYRHHHAWTHQDFGGKLPSEVFREHIFSCFIDDKVGIANRHLTGIDTIMWECDYPHSDTTWPHSPEVLWESLEGVPDEDINKMTFENAMREFQWDFTAARPKDRCTVAALREEGADVDLTLMKGMGGSAAHEQGNRIVTAGDIVQQLSDAFVEPAA